MTDEIESLLIHWRRAKKDFENARKRILHFEERITEARKKKGEP